MREAALGQGTKYWLCRREEDVVVRKMGPLTALTGIKGRAHLITSAFSEV